jgi:hypothetical protein
VKGLMLAPVAPVAPLAPLAEVVLMILARLPCREAAGPSTPDSAITTSSPEPSPLPSPSPTPLSSSQHRTSHPSSAGEATFSARSTTAATLFTNRASGPSIAITGPLPPTPPPPTLPPPAAAAAAARRAPEAAKGGLILSKTLSLLPNPILITIASTLLACASLSFSLSPTTPPPP